MFLDSFPCVQRLDLYTTFLVEGSFSQLEIIRLRLQEVSALCQHTSTIISREIAVLVSDRSALNDV